MSPKGLYTLIHSVCLVSLARAFESLKIFNSFLHLVISKLDLTHLKV